MERPPGYYWVTFKHDKSKEVVELSGGGSWYFTGNELGFSTDELETRCAIEGRIDRDLVDKLKGYAVHDKFVCNWPANPCTCGLTEVLKEME